MNYDLLSQNLLLVLCALVTALSFYLIYRIFTSVKFRKSKKALKENKRRKIKESLLVLVVSFAASFLITLYVSHETDSTVPKAFILMVFPIFFAFCLLVLVIRKKIKLKTIVMANLVVSILFSLLLINNYYRFYPTLNQVFNINTETQLGSSEKEVELQFADLSSKSLDSTSIEGSLASLNTQPTKGTVYNLNIPGTVSKFKARTAFVYVPAIYNNPTKINLPVLVLLPGVPGLPENWLGSGLEATMDAFASHHDGITPIVFMVDDTGTVTNDTECVNSPRGNVETYLSVDVPNYIKSHFEVATDPSHWAIGGLSMGGNCAIMLALLHPDVYHYFLDFGGERGPEIGSKQTTVDTLFGGSEQAWQDHQPAYLLATRTYKGMGGFFALGNQDDLSVTQAASMLSADSKKAGLETVYEILNGQHTFNVWQDAFRLSLPWVSNRLGATECGATCI